MKNFKGVLLAIVLVIISISAFSQIKILPNGKVGINDSNPLSRLSINVDGDSLYQLYCKSFNTTSSASAAYFLQQAVPTGYCFGSMSSVSVTSADKLVGSMSYAYAGSPTNARTFGIKAAAGNGYSGFNYGIHAYLYGSSTIGAALFSCIPGRNEIQIPFLCAGYFRGTIYVEDSIGINLTNTTPYKRPQYPIDVNGIVRASNYLYLSDGTLKKNINSLGSNVISKIQQLRGVTYQFKTPTELNPSLLNESKTDTGKNDRPIPSYDSELYTKYQIGFIAEEVQKVFPEIVYTDKQGLLSLNYAGLIPVLLEAIKNQQGQIDSLKNFISKGGSISLKSGSISTSIQNTEINAIDAASLSQNAPNPFSQETSIAYFLPETIQNATLNIYDMNGIQIKSVPISSKGKGSVVINGYELRPGMYLYTLIADNHEVATKRMILTD